MSLSSDTIKKLEQWKMNEDDKKLLDDILIEPIKNILSDKGIKYVINIFDNTAHHIEFIFNKSSITIRAVNLFSINLYHKEIDMPFHQVIEQKHIKEYLEILSKNVK